MVEILFTELGNACIYTSTYREMTGLQYYMRFRFISPTLSLPTKQWSALFSLKILLVLRTRLKVN